MTGSNEFTLVVPAGSRISLSANARASASTPSRAGSQVSYEGQADAWGNVYVSADAPFTSDSGHNYSPDAP